MEGYHHHHHRLNVSASQTQEHSRFTTLHRLYPSSSDIPNSRSSHIPSSMDDVPITTAGPITISAVIILTFVICMILNCGKLRRKLSLYRNNKCSQPLLIDTEKCSASVLTPPSGKSRISSTFTIFHPTFPPPVAQQPYFGHLYAPHFQSSKTNIP